MSKKGDLRLKNLVITIIGAGNAGFHLAKRLKKCGHEILQVYSRNIARAEALAQLIKSQPIDDLSQLDTGADIYIIAVPDDAIVAVATQIKLQDKVVVHISGSVPVDVLSNASLRTGVFYPLQTFTTNTPVDFSAIPICIFSENEQVLEILHTLAAQTGGTVAVTNDRQRQYLHLAAVFINNFTNHMAVAAEEILSKKNIDFQLLKPLLEQTVKKIFSAPPASMQTGPAVRNDRETIHRHLQLLNEFPQYEAIYSTITENILATKKLQEK